MALSVLLSPLEFPWFFLPKCKKNVLQVTIKSHTANKISSQANDSGSPIFRFWGLNRMKIMINIAGRIKAVGNDFKSCFFVILIDENNLDNQSYALNDITHAIEIVRTTSITKRESMII